MELVVVGPVDQGEEGAASLAVVSFAGVVEQGVEVAAVGIEPVVGVEVEGQEGRRGAALGVDAASEDGTVLAMKAGLTLEIVSRTSIRKDADEVFRSSMAISNGQLLVRSDRRLYCVGN